MMMEKLTRMVFGTACCCLRLTSCYSLENDNGKGDPDARHLFINSTNHTDKEEEDESKKRRKKKPTHHKLNHVGTIH
jgi:hypothetical protein